MAEYGKKAKDAENIKNAEGQTTAAAAAAAAAGTGNKWQTAKKAKELEDIKSVEGHTTAAATAVAKNWDNVAKAVESGTHLKKVDTTNSMWNTAFAKYKSPQRLKDLTEAQAVQITKTAAKEVAKNPPSDATSSGSLSFRLVPRLRHSLSLALTRCCPRHGGVLR